MEWERGPGSLLQALRVLETQKQNVRRMQARPDLVACLDLVLVHQALCAFRAVEEQPLLQMSTNRALVSRWSP